MNHENFTPRDLLAHLSIKHGGNWAKIYSDIQTKVKVDPQDLSDSLANNKRKFVTVLDEDAYPESFIKGVRPPFVLFLEGDAELLKTPSNKILSLAGDAAPSEYGAEQAKLMGKACADLGIVLCAKIANGCARQALLACATAGGKCIGVMSSGIDRPYPSKEKTEGTINAILAAGGVVISEHPDGADPTPGTFTSSGRLVAALGKALYVPQMGKNGGAAITVAFALNGNKDIAAAPFEAGDPEAANNELIRNGATLVDDAVAFLTETFLGQN